MNEIEAIVQLKRGDVRGLEVLVRKYQLDAVRISNAIIKDLSLAEEIVQEAFLRVYRCIDQFDETRPFKAWFLRIIVNDSLKILTYQNRLVPLEKTDDCDNTNLVDILAEGKLWFEQEEFSKTHENAQILQEMMNNLTPAHRAVLELKYYLDMADEEIALVVQIPLGTVKSRLHSAKLMLRSMLDRDDFSLNDR